MGPYASRNSSRHGSPVDMGPPNNGHSGNGSRQSSGGPPSMTSGGSASHTVTPSAGVSQHDFAAAFAGQHNGQKKHSHHHPSSLYGSGGHYPHSGSNSQPGSRAHSPDVSSGVDKHGQSVGGSGDSLSHRSHGHMSGFSMPPISSGQTYASHSAGGSKPPSPASQHRQPQSISQTLQPKYEA